jgi:circadian clock protein KaiB
MANDKDMPLENEGNYSDQEKTGVDQGQEQPRAFFQLRLFVSGSTSRSQQAIQNLRQICEEHLQGRYRLEVIDVTKDPEQVRNRQILAVPTLIKELPHPLRKLVGDLSEKEKVLAGLDIQPKDPE